MIVTKGTYQQWGLISPYVSFVFYSDMSGPLEGFVLFFSFFPRLFLYILSDIRGSLWG